MHTLRLTVRWLARIGYGARGLVYLFFGVLVLRAAWELSEAEDVRGTLNALQGEPGGQIVLFALAIGLAAYGIWRLVQSLLDVDRHGWGPAALAVRGGLLVSAFSYGSLAWAGFALAMSWSSGQGRSQPVQDAVAATLQWPYGRELVAVLGAAIVGVGIAHIAKAARGSFRKWFDAWPGAMWWIDPVSRIGLTARGLLFIGIGGFVVYSAITLDPSDAKGMEGLLSWVQQHVYGRIMLAALGLGVILFGCYSLIEAFVRRVGLGAKV
ncbi:DUF1206 domain-containing protein [Salinisphaera sp.]|uniref:DUF1206 domain-containing protein n=1 Tax=Salinisphaera sp. TaxID=1914330 RepID=UPI002D7742CC|nr:DUF1206 domain-containing protein [Salinisphaera sp.]HET7313486.1 DUF1206 domain-containing protein [Salinisphaera sp.]